MVQSTNLTLTFSSESSIEEELKRESTADIITIAVSHEKHEYLDSLLYPEKLVVAFLYVNPNCPIFLFL